MTKSGEHCQGFIRLEKLTIFYIFDRSTLESFSEECVDARGVASTHSSQRKVVLSFDGEIIMC